MRSRTMQVKPHMHLPYTIIPFLLATDRTTGVQHGIGQKRAWLLLLIDRRLSTRSGRKARTTTLSLSLLLRLNHLDDLFDFGQFEILG